MSLRRSSGPANSAPVRRLLTATSMTGHRPIRKAAVATEKVSAEGPSPSQAPKQDFPCTDPDNY